MKRSIAVLLILFAVVGTYAPSVRDGFVWDDTALILRDPLIRSWRLIPEGFNHFLFTDATASDFYRPIQRVAYTLEYAAFAFNPGAYHSASVLFHATAAVALLLLAEEFFFAFGMEQKKRRWISLIAALVWAVHPVQSAAVVYVSGLADPLAACFGFLGCYLALRSLRDRHQRDILWLLAACLAFMLSALSKETGLIFPVLAIVISAMLKNARAVLKMAMVAAFVATIYLSLRQAAEHNPSPSPRASAPLVTRPIVMARAFAEYAGLVVFPLNLHMDRHVEARPTESAETNMSLFAWRELQTLLGILLIAALGYWAAKARQRNPVVLTLLILTAVSYFPISGIAALNATVAEHWIYIPTAFFFLAATVATAQLFELRQARRQVVQAVSVVFGCWLTFLAARTCLRTFDWKDQRTFLERTIAAGGDSPRMQINLAGLELSEGRPDRAKTFLDTALRAEPDQPLAVINLAVVALKQNDFKTARELATRATQMPRVDAQAHELLALLENKEKGHVSLLRLRLAARTGSPNWAIEKRYVRLIDETGATSNAIRELQTCLQTEWYRAESWQLLGQLLTKIGHEQEAAVARAQAAAYDVHLAEHSNVL